MIDDRQEHAVLEEIKKILDYIPRICFVGFAYDEQNLSALGFHAEKINLRRQINQMLYGTTLGMKRREMESIEKVTGVIISEPSNCYNGLRELGVLR